MTLRRIWFLIGWVLVASVVWGSITTDPPSGPKVPHFDKFGHAFSYSLLMGWFWPLYGRRGRLLWAAALIGLGIALEFVQAAGGVRQFELADMVADAAGVAAVFLLCRLGVCRPFDPLVRHLAAPIGPAVGARSRAPSGGAD